MAWNIISEDGFDTIQSDTNSLKIARLGAELVSFKINHKTLGWTGLLVNDDDMNADHHYWKRHAPFLFPIVGGLQNDKSETSDGKKIELPSHGFARISTFQLIDSGTNSDSAWLEYSLSRTQAAEHLYPWDCTINIKFTLSKDKLDTDVRITNDSDDTMWYQFGWHPGFMAPVSGDASKRSDIQIDIPHGTYTLKGITSECLLTNNDSKLIVDGPLKLSDKELEDTYILDMESVDNRWISLYDPQSEIKTTVQFDQYPHLGIWALPDSPYICVEPWQGCDDYLVPTSFDNKFGITSLSSGESNSRTISTTVEQ